MALICEWRYAQLRSRSVPEYIHGVHRPTKVLPQSPQAASGPSLVMSRCRHFLQRAQQRPELSGTPCL